MKIETVLLKSYNLDRADSKDVDLLAVRLPNGDVTMVTLGKGYDESALIRSIETDYRALDYPRYKTFEDLLKTLSWPGIVRRWFRERQQAKVAGMHETTQRIYTFILDYHERTGLTPTLREMTLVLNVSSTSTAAFHVKKLIKAGLLAREPKQSRGLRIL